MILKLFKKIALLLVSIASLLMFLPTVLPHHHHGEAICFCSHPEKHDTGEHHCDTHTDTEAVCTLNINYFIPNNDDDKVSCVIDLDNEHHHHGHDNTYIDSCLECDMYFLALNLRYHAEKNIYKTEKYSFLFINKLSGRAPPCFFIA